MRLSEERIRHISHLILDDLKVKKCINSSNDAALLHSIKKMLFDYFKVEDEIDDFVRQKIRSYSRVISEGSREWDIMYDKLFREEMGKKGFSF